jgi:hypothetical protein
MKILDSIKLPFEIFSILIMIVVWGFKSTERMLLCELEYQKERNKKLTEIKEKQKKIKEIL